MTYQFDTEFAQRYGLQEAIFCQSLLYWIIKNAANERHWHTAEVTLPDGETATVEGYWMYNSAKAFTRLFPFWTARQIETIVKKCREKGLIYTANFAEKPTDRTTWYALTENVKCIYAKCEMDSTECVNPFTILRKCLKGTVKNTVENQEGAQSPLPDHEEEMADGRDPSLTLRMTGEEMADGRDPRVPRGVSLALGMTGEERECCSTDGVLACPEGAKSRPLPAAGGGSGFAEEEQSGRKPAGATRRDDSDEWASRCAPQDDMGAQDDRGKKKSGGRKETPKAVIERLAQYVNTFGALDAAQLGGALFDFAENRRALGSPIRTERAAELLIRKLDRLSGGDTEKKIALLEEATLNGWKSVYPLHERAAGPAARSDEAMEEWT